jgi:hypothetical protein
LYLVYLAENREPAMRVLSDPSMLPRRARRWVGVAAAVVLVAGVLPAVSYAAPGPAKSPAKAAGSRDADGRRAFYDARQDAAAQPALTNRAAAQKARPAVTDLRATLGDQGIVDIDPLTGTPRQVARLDGFLTAATRTPAVTVATGYLKAHADLFGLDAARVDGLKLRQDYVDIAGTQHLSFQQMVGGVPVFGNGLRADVTKNGQLIQVTGAPVAALPESLGVARLTAAQAHDDAVRDAGAATRTPAAKVRAQSATPDRATTFTTGDKAQLVAFQTPGGTRLGWQTITLRPGYLHVVDAVTGRVLYRQSLVQRENAPDALVWTNYPGAPKGGKQKLTSLAPWVPANATNLTGNSSHVFLDLNDNDVADPGEEVGPSAPGHFKYPLVDFTAQDGGVCSAQFRCTWDPKVPFSWQANQKQDATQLLYFTSVFHDHLAAAPIGFTRAAGNFETRDGDPVEVNDLDGANLDNGFPDLNHSDNANMNTPPDGIPPTMQMYLQPFPGDPTDPFVPSDVGDEASSVYHEYTHGLSNRLVVDADGVSTLNSPQAGAMGEAWSDWYAYDYLTSQGLEKDTRKPGELVVFEYSTAGLNLIRTQPIDCSVGAPASVCPGTPRAGSGGYTYGDYGKVIGRPEVHADGEIWAETLWDLRTKLGSRLADSLVTRAMELSPADPSFLDMRNSILQADLVVDNGFRQKDIWKVFANRGMGFFAATSDASDSQPIEDFSMPPGPNAPRGTLAGTVTDQLTGQPVVGAVVGFGGHNSGFAGSYQAVTDNSGRFRIANIVAHTYPKVSARAPGYEPVERTVVIGASQNTANWAIRRDWAATAGGSTVTAFNGDDFSPFGCGPGSAVDLSQGAGWSSDAEFPTVGGPMDPRFITVRLPAAVNVAQIAINPTANCGDDPSASTGDYMVETSADGTKWTVAATGHFGVADRDRMDPVPLAAGSTAGVRYIRYTMLGTQVAEEGATCPSDFSGCLFTDTVEVAVYGAAS